MRILIVEDESQLAEATKALLEKHHYAVDVAHDGEAGLDLALLDIYDLIILDIMLPKKDGIEVLNGLRTEGLSTPVILLTARTAVMDRVNGLDAGADDYLSKPFEAMELLARIRALGRRNGLMLEKNVLEFGDLAYSQQNLSLEINDKTYTLTKKEGQLLELLMKARGTIIAKDRLLDKIWGFEESAADNNIEVYVSFLRKKLKSAQAKTQIKTVRGVGYKLVMDEE